jgi:hypothetical protein
MIVFMTALAQPARPKAKLANAINAIILEVCLVILFLSCLFVFPGSRNPQHTSIRPVAEWPGQSSRLSYINRRLACKDNK